MSASYNDYLQKYILIFINDEVDEPDQGVYVATSEDGIRWSDPVPVWKVNSQLDKPGKPAVNYPSLIGIGKNSTMETSKENWLLYRYDFPDGSPSIARRALTFDCPGPS